MWIIGECAQSPGGNVYNPQKLWGLCTFPGDCAQFTLVLGNVGKILNIISFLHIP